MAAFTSSRATSLSRWRRRQRAAALQRSAAPGLRGVALVCSAKATTWIGDEAGREAAARGGAASGTTSERDGVACARRAVRNCVLTRDMRPLEDFSPAAFAWEQVAAMPLQHRHHFASMVRPADFAELWELAGEHIALGWSVYGDAPRWVSLRHQLTELSPLAKRMFDGTSNMYGDIEYDPSIALFDLAFEGNVVGSAMYRGRLAVYSDGVDGGEEETLGSMDESAQLRARLFMNKTTPLGLFGRPMYAKVATELTRIVGEGNLEADGVMWFPWKIVEDMPTREEHQATEMLDDDEHDESSSAGESGAPEQSTGNATPVSGDAIDGNVQYVPHPRWPIPEDDNERRGIGGYVAYLRVLGPGVVIGRLYSGYKGEYDTAGGGVGRPDHASSDAVYDVTQREILPMNLTLERHFVMSRNLLADVPNR